VDDPEGANALVSVKRAMIVVAVMVFMVVWFSVAGIRSVTVL